jgi:hypothetical protein
MTGGTAAMRDVCVQENAITRGKPMALFIIEYFQFALQNKDELLSFKPKVGQGRILGLWEIGEQKRTKLLVGPLVPQGFELITVGRSFS